ncbi:CD3324 family protein [Paenibacillus sp. IHB B 3415]|uniref:CD3324 family protein n=1 Tax=Paenibacillus sp. IHB B 3415 TaxID=867080 RepID=UPI0007C83392|nr:CD3324 family protein [Paenibacillus sp. IHB B 3415]
MKYEHAGDVIPEELLKEVQKYAAGRLLYFPAGDEKKAWGESNGYREQLQKRNLMIRNKYAHGVTIAEIANEYYLSLDTVKKIIYSKKNDRHLTYAPTVESAVRYMDAGMIEEWIQCYLLLTRKTLTGLVESGKQEQLYFGVVKFPLRLIEQNEMRDLSDNQPGSTGTAHEEDGNTVASPPLVIQYTEGKFHCPVQQEILAALKQRKVNAYPAVIGMNGSDDYRRFMKYYGTVLHYVNEVEG